jgi:hypothetical protein
VDRVAGFLPCVDAFGGVRCWLPGDIGLEKGQSNVLL